MFDWVVNTLWMVCTDMAHVDGDDGSAGRRRLQLVDPDCKMMLRVLQGEEGVVTARGMTLMARLLLTVVTAKQCQRFPTLTHSHPPTLQASHPLSVTLLARHSPTTTYG